MQSEIGENTSSKNITDLFDHSWSKDAFAIGLRKIRLFWQSIMHAEKRGNSRLRKNIQIKWLVETGIRIKPWSRQ